MCSVRFAALGVMVLVTAQNTVMDKVIESAAHGVMDQEEERKCWIDDVVECSLGFKAAFNAYC